MKIFVLLLALLVAAQAHSVHFQQEVETYRVNTSTYLDIYYPTSQEGDFPVILFNVGGNVQASDYTQVAAQIAALGYIVAVPQPELVQAGPPGTPLMRLLSWSKVLEAKNLVKTESESSCSPLYGKADTSQYVFVGHSFGGVLASAMASQDGVVKCNNPADPFFFVCAGYPGFGEGDIKAVIGYGTTFVNQGALVDLNTTGMPHILVRGSIDGVASLDSLYLTYNTSLETPKAIVELLGGNHFAITDTNEPVGSAHDPVEQVRSQERTQKAFVSLVSLVLKGHVEGHVPSLRRLYKKRSLGRDLDVLEANYGNCKPRTCPDQCTAIFP